MSNLKNKKIVAFLIPLVIISLIAAVSIAYLTISTGNTENKFKMAAAPTPDIPETFDKQIKKDVKVSLSNNDGESGSYFVRALIVITLQDDDGNVINQVPQSGIDYTIDQEGIDWTKIGNYWYYNGSVPTGGLTTNLINTCNTLNEEYHLTVDVLAQTIQAEPSYAVEEAWGMIYNADAPQVWTVVTE